MKSQMRGQLQLLRGRFDYQTQRLSKIRSHRTETFASMLAGIGALSYLFRETFLGPVRYYLFQYHFDAIWFAPDVLALSFMLFYVLRAILNPSGRFPATIFTAAILISSLTGLVVSGSFYAWLSGLKLFCPIFVGLFLEPRFFWKKSVVTITLALLILSILGIYLSSVMSFPWADQSFDVFGQTRVAAVSRWIGAESRFFGFSADNTAAAFKCLIFYVILSAALGRKFAIALFLPTFLAIEMTTSRTAVISLLLFGGVEFAEYAGKFTGILARQNLWVRLVRFCPLAIGVPILTVYYFSVTVVQYQLQLYSLVDRSTNAWVLPFQYLNELVPTSILTGFGIGAIGGPMLFSRLSAYFSSVDNFILFSFLMFGPLSFLFVFFAPAKVIATGDAMKMMIYFVLTIFGITVAGYGDGLFVLLYGYVVSGLLNPSLHSKASRPLANLHSRRLMPERIGAFEGS